MKWLATHQISQIIREMLRNSSNLSNDEAKCVATHHITQIVRFQLFETHQNTQIGGDKWFETHQNTLIIRGNALQLCNHKYCIQIVRWKWFANTGNQTTHVVRGKWENSIYCLPRLWKGIWNSSELHKYWEGLQLNQLLIWWEIMTGFSSIQVYQDWTSREVGETIRKALLQR